MTLASEQITLTLSKGGRSDSSDDLVCQLCPLLLLCSYIRKKLGLLFEILLWNLSLHMISSSFCHPPLNLVSENVYNFSLKNTFWIN